jgi:hypothetical protein
MLSFINVACWLLGSNARTRAEEVEKAFLIAGAGAPVMAPVH